MWRVGRGKEGGEGEGGGLEARGRGVGGRKQLASY